MKHLALPTALAVTLGGVALAAPAATASPASAKATAPVTHRVDIDGDGRLDTVSLTLVSVRRDHYGFRLAVRTATGKRASLPVYVENLAGLTAKDVWVGVTGIDGVRGNEVMLDLGGGVGDFPWLHTYTWRNGKLSVLAAPGSTNRQLSWVLVTPPFGVDGYTFSMKGSTRYVVHHHLKPSASRRTYSGTNTTYRWTAKGWARVKTAKSGVVSAKTANTLADFRGLIWR